MTREMRATAQKSLGKLWSQFTRPMIVKLVTPNLFVGFGAAILIPYMNVYFREKFNASNETLGVLFSLASVSTGVAILVGPLLAKWLGKVRAVVFTQSASLFFMGLIGFAPTFVIPALAFVARSALMNMGNPLYQAFMMEQIPEEEQATVNSVGTMMWNIGWAFGPAISGWVQQRYGFTPLFITTIILYIIGTFMVWIFFRQTEALQTRALSK
jgi:predicted MFS family arabinose efflux permease